MNIITNCFFNETVNCDDIDAPWMKSLIKHLFGANNNFYKKFVHKTYNIQHLCASKDVTDQSIASFHFSFVL